MEFESKEKSSPLGPYLKTHYIGKGKRFKNIIELAATLNKSRQTLSMVMNGLQPLSRSLADQLAEHVGNSMEFWLDLSRGKLQSYGDIDYEHTTKEELLDFWRRIGGRFLVDKDIKAAQRVGVIDIDPFDADCVQTASYDLRLGAKLYYSPSDDVSADLEKNGEYNLKPGARVTCTTYEHLRFPNYIFGPLGNLSDLSLNGVNVYHGIQIDPTFSGKLWLSVINHSRNTYSLVFCQPIISMTLYFLPIQPESIYDGDKKEKEYLSEKEKKSFLFTN